MDDDVYRAFLQSTVGKTSCKEMDIAELLKVLQAMKNKGFVPTSTKFKHQRRAKPAEHKELYLRKITALLTEHQLPQSYADSIAKRSFKVDFVHWLDVWQLKKVIQMLEVYNRKQQRDEEQKTQ
ncbi:TPA: regulatory protein GemA [Pasteurella multocida]|uniref:gp16 family protein n=1 Tax=Pasteurella multocida TaxID=747 RepID=UPI0029AA1C82|nr:regulatory protein GemA [Pasteurella multocida]MEB4587012.1 regulatory protein GemA [Pasteurella multocida]HEH9717252.1 regulatory protein GemA [Pasteurella multocida]HEH9728194.1 regulatory protein GemA [Pasteurella multocida]HEH9735321.1 regulatory protein GemA [Pasteurella multocida]HEH9766928.1 regulatory protein GemA [Pasteurella multocida]